MYHSQLTFSTPFTSLFIDIVVISLCFSFIPFFKLGVLGGSYKINSLGSWGISTKAFKIWRGGKCSVAVPSTLHVIFIFDSHSTVSIGCCCHSIAAHSSVARRLSRLAVSFRQSAVVVSRRQNVSESSRRQSALRVCEQQS